MTQNRMLTLSVMDPGEPLLSQFFTLWDRLQMGGYHVTLSSIPIDESEVAEREGKDLADEEDANTLDGATEPPQVGIRFSTSGGFAALWNSISATDRTAMVEKIIDDADQASQCFMEDHRGRLEEFERSRS